MALDQVQFTDRFGRPLPQKLRDQLVECVISAIAHPKADIEAVLKRAQAIARRAADGQIEDVQHYATKALFAVSRKASLKREREPIASQTPRRMEILAGAATEGSPSALEDRVLLQELLSGLPEIDRKVLIRHIEGWEHREIASELGISESDELVPFKTGQEKAGVANGAQAIITNRWRTIRLKNYCCVRIQTPNGRRARVRTQSGG